MRVWSVLADTVVGIGAVSF